MLKSFGLQRRLLVLLIALCLSPTALAASQTSDEANIRQFQNWEVRCPNTGGSADRCTMTQEVNNPDNNKPLMRVVVAYPPQIDGPVMVFLLPLGVRLAPGLQLSIDDSQGPSFPYQICRQQGCRADLPLQPELLQQLRAGHRATLSLIGPDGQRRDLAISLMGFTSASQAIAP
ncbi:invasion associated locus B family protein [Kushneria phosphatilytica]|uniref:Invasion associated locus B family protein n=1 Tax=Kushneria phosphatilytica TaxID=657387 RepID=A0A1S1NTL0_9GAMM|nr:invasion associated locus B family protein [Kushneria phosphatilytica]OHV12894.1 Invasion protein B-like protein [Kushneria phosphatilytica]QEL10755.1 invasion associated locus B family protein [Kushneria phosphatilytica]